MNAQLIVQAILLLLEIGPDIYKTLDELIDNSDLGTFDKEELKLKIKLSQDKWKEWT